LQNKVLQEGKLFWLLKHQNIVGLLGVCLEEPNFSLVMEYARGGALNRALRYASGVFLNWLLRSPRAALLVGLSVRLVSAWGFS
jgi:mitogen-activated protein kinase kinase kinase 9